MVQINKSSGRSNLKRHKEQIPAAFQQAQKEKGKQEQERVWNHHWVPERERSRILDKKAASIGCKKCTVRKNQRGQRGE